MKRLITLFSIVMLLMAVPAMAFDLSKPLGLGNEKTLVVDVELRAARPFEAEYSVTDNAETLNIAGREHEWFLKAEAGIKVLDTVRAYLNWQSITNIYAERRYGVEVLFPVSGVDSGVFTEYVNRTDYKVAQDKYGMAGFLMRF